MKTALVNFNNSRYKINPDAINLDYTLRNEKYNDVIDDKYYGICKSISELYVSILKDKRIGISAELVKKYPDIS